MLVLLILSVVLSFIALFVVSGLIGIGTVSSFRSIVGSLLMGSCLSMLLSIISTWILASFPLETPDKSNVWSLFNLFLKTVLAALASPTVTGVALLSILVLLSYAAAKLSGMIEDMHVITLAMKSESEGRRVESADKKRS